MDDLINGRMLNPGILEIEYLISLLTDLVSITQWSFFKSYSELAPNPAINILRHEIINNDLFTKDPSKAPLKRIIKYTPAVTSVEEWTNADTGVGAAISAGNHAEKGIWALLVIAEIIQRILNISHLSSIYHL